MARLGRRQSFKPIIKRALLIGVAFDATSNSGDQIAQSTYGWNHTWSGGNRYIAVDVEILSVPGTTVTSITYNGVALTLIGARSTISGAGRVECWGASATQLSNLAAGTYTVTVTLSASVESVANAVSYQNVNQSSPTEAFNSAQATNVGAADATVNITTISAGCWVHAAAVADDTSITAGQNTRNNTSGVAGSGANEDNNLPVAVGSVVTMTYTNVAALATWAIAGYGIRPVSSAVSITHYTTTGGTGSFSLTGNTTNLLYNRSLPAETGSFVETGIAASLLYAHKIVCEAGVFTETGIAAGLKATRTLSCNVGSFNLTGNDSNLLATHVITVDAGAFTLDGIGVDFAIFIPPSIPSSTGGGGGSGGGRLGSRVGGPNLGLPWLIDKHKWPHGKRPKPKPAEAEDDILATILEDDEDILLVLASMDELF